MAQKRGKPGSKKGQPKPKVRVLDPGFPARFAQAVGDRPIPELARKLACSRAVLGNYLNGKNKNIDAILLFDLAKELDVSPRWLIKNESGRDTRSAELKNVIQWLNTAEEDEKTLFFKFTEKFLQASEK